MHSWICTNAWARAGLSSAVSWFTCTAPSAACFQLDRRMTSMRLSTSEPRRPCSGRSPENSWRWDFGLTPPVRVCSTDGGARTVSAPGTTQALNRTEPVEVLVGGRTGTVLRPNLIAALVGKAAARTEIPTDRASRRHSADFVMLASLISGRDFKETELTKKDRRRLQLMLEQCRSETSTMSVEGAARSLEHLERSAGLD